jgi:hypothetical protein
MNQFNEYDAFRRVYIDNIVKGAIPIVPAYYYYTLHLKKGQYKLTKDEFEQLFAIGICGGYNVISEEEEEALMDIQEIYTILNHYYCVNFLFDKDNNLINVV